MFCLLICRLYRPTKRSQENVNGDHGHLIDVWGCVISTPAGIIALVTAAPKSRKFQL